MFITTKKRDTALALNVTYETVRSWCAREKLPRGKNLHDLCAYMRTQLAPDEYDAFRSSLVADLLGEAKHLPALGE